MPTPGNPKHSVRVADPTWAEFVRACDEVSEDPNAMLLMLIRWWGREPGVTLPRRPKRD